MKNIYLVGFMGTGKTTIAKALAARLKRHFLEMDAVIEEREGSEIVDIFKEKGEAYFRKVEKEVLKDLSRKSDLVVSCGGGVVMNAGNLKVLKETGLVFCLNADSTTIYERVKQYGHRPLLNVDDPQAEIEELLNLRNAHYQQAHYQIDATRSLDEVIGQIIEILGDG